MGRLGSTRQRLRVEEAATKLYRPKGNSDGFQLSERWPELDRVGPYQEYAPGSVLARQSLAVMEVFFIERGLVKLKRLDDGGRKEVVGLRTPGWILGAAAAILQRPHPATIETVTRCYLRTIPAADFCHLMKTNTQFSWYVAMLHSQELYDHVAQVTCLAYLSSR